MHMAWIQCWLNIPESYSFFSLLQNLYVFVSGSCVHQRWLEVQKQMFPAPREVLMETWGACRYKSWKAVRDRLSAIILPLKELRERGRGTSPNRCNCNSEDLELKLNQLKRILERRKTSGLKIAEVEEAPRHIVRHLTPCWNFAE